MKILHTGDWHLGHTLYGFDRSEEQAALIDQLEEILREEAPDALVVSGDIFHTPQPSASIQTFFTESVMRLRAAAPDMTVVILAGNHDSASRHEVTKVLWETQGVHMLGSVDKDRLGDLIVEIPGKGFVAAVPYLNERSIPDGFYQSLLDAVASRNGANLPVVMAAHLTVTGSDFTGHEDVVRDVTVGGIDGVPLDSLGTGYDYLALGHIHRPQTLPGSDGRARYSGTPVAVSFDEAYPHSVSLVEIAAHGARPDIRPVEIRNPRPLVTLPARDFADWDTVKALLEAFPKDKPAYLRLNVAVDDFLPKSAEQEARALLKDTPVKFTYINSRRKVTASGPRKGVTVAQFQAMSPLSVAEMYAADSGLTFDDDLKKLFREAEAEVEQDNRHN